MALGKVKWFNAAKGFGFITPNDGSGDLFAHYSEIQATGYKNLTENQSVQYEVSEGDKGLQATNIRTYE